MSIIKTPLTPPDVFDRRAPHYDRLDWVFDAAFARVIVTFCQPGSSERVLDLGTGTGAVPSFLRDLSARICALDRSLPMLAKARALLGDTSGLDLLAGNGETLPFKPAVFDLVVCRNALHHFAAPRRGLAEVQRVLKAGGRFVLIEPVAPCLKAKALWSELFRLRDKGRHPDFYFSPEELAQYTAPWFHTAAVRLTRVAMPLERWLDTGCVSPGDKATLRRVVQRAVAGERQAAGLHRRLDFWEFDLVWCLLRLVKK